MEKKHILDEIVRMAQQNNDKPLGKARFEAETGIKESDWSGKYSVRWSDAVREAGFSPNTMQKSYDQEWLLERLISLIRELDHFPVRNEVRLKTRTDKTFPNEKTFQRLGSKAELANKIVEYCAARTGYEDIIQVCSPLSAAAGTSKPEQGSPHTPTFGYVYLMKSGRYYKIGRSNSLGRREYELGIQLPEPAKTIHCIKTDDPPGIEAYWHGRFEAKRKGGEWFELSRDDVQAFRRRKFM